MDPKYLTQNACNINNKKQQKTLLIMLQNYGKLEQIVALSWSKAKHDESEVCDPMNRCQGAECKEGRLMKGGPTLKG